VRGNDFSAPRQRTGCLSSGGPRYELRFLTDAGFSVSQTGQGPYDGVEDSLIGVVNNSSRSISAIAIKSALPIFAFDGDGIDTYGISGNALDSTGYGGPNAYFTNINPAATAGIVNFVVPIPANGGIDYFSLEEDIGAAYSCKQVINGALAAPPVGRLNTANIDASLTPGNVISGLTLQQAASYCGFVNFDWAQLQETQFDPSAFWAAKLGGGFDPAISGPVNLTSSTTPFNDPPPGGGYTCVGALDCTLLGNPAENFSYPFYYMLGSDLSNHESGGLTLTFHDAPGDPCLPGGQGANRSACNNTEEPAGSYDGFITDLAGVNADGTATDLGIGITWTSDYNGTSGGVYVNLQMPLQMATGLAGLRSRMSKKIQTINMMES
jgi:hypothetical protein